MLSFVLALADNPTKKEIVKAIYTEHRFAMRYAALAVLGREDLAEDAVHDAMVELIEGLEHVPTHDPQQLRGFMMLLTRHRALDILRRERGRYIQPLSSEPQNEPAVWDHYEGLEFADLLAAMNELPEIYREILELHVRYDLSPKELAKFLSINEQTAYKRLQRAQNMMREKWSTQNADK